MKNQTVIYWKKKDHTLVTLPRRGTNKLNSLDKAMLSTGIFPSTVSTDIRKTFRMQLKVFAGNITENQIKFNAVQHLDRVISQIQMLNDPVAMDLALKLKTILS